jgi:hypothetical protein
MPTLLQQRNAARPGIPTLLAAMMWARSYWHFDFGVARA